VLLVRLVTVPKFLRVGRVYRATKLERFLIGLWLVWTASAQAMFKQVPNAFKQVLPTFASVQTLWKSRGLEGL